MRWRMSGARLEAENRVGEIDRAGALADRALLTSAFITWPYSFAACGSRSVPGGTQGAGLRRILGQRRLTASRTETQPPFAPGTAPRTMIRPRSLSVLHHLKIQRGDALVAHVAGHLLALEYLAGVLALAGRAVAAVA